MAAYLIGYLCYILSYPKPIVDHATAKTHYVEEFKRVLATK